MENASKALIIAASVLVSILIIAMGVRIFNGAQNAADMTTLDSTEIAMFNSKFERYSDTQLGSQVKSLISFAISNASTNGDDPIKLPTVGYIELSAKKNDKNIEDNHYIKRAKGSTDATADISKYVETLGEIRAAMVSTHSYDVKLIYGKTGLIEEIRIFK